MRQAATKSAVLLASLSQRVRRASARAAPVVTSVSVYASAARPTVAMIAIAASQRRRSVPASTASVVMIATVVQQAALPTAARTAKNAIRRPADSGCMSEHLSLFQLQPPSPSLKGKTEAQPTEVIIDDKEVRPSVIL